MHLECVVLSLHYVPGNNKPASNKPATNKRDTNKPKLSVDVLLQLKAAMALLQCSLLKTCIVQFCV